MPLSEKATLPILDLKVTPIKSRSSSTTDLCSNQGKKSEANTIQKAKTGIHDEYDNQGLMCLEDKTKTIHKSWGTIGMPSLGTESDVQNFLEKANR